MNQKLLDSIALKLNKALDELFDSNEPDLDIVANLARQAAEQAEQAVIVDDGVFDD